MSSSSVQPGALSGSGNHPRLLFVAPLPPPFGGVCFLTRALLKAGLGDGYALVHLDTSKKTTREDYGKITFLDIRVSLRNLFCFVWLLFSTKPEIVYIQATADTGFYRDWLFVVTARLASCRVVLHLHGTRRSAPFKSGWFHSRLLRWSVSRASYVVVPTEADREGFQDLALQVPVVVVRNPTHVPPELRNNGKRARVSDGRRLVGIGRLSEAKGTWDLLEALAVVRKSEPHIHLTWVGSGAFSSDDEYAEHLVKSLGLDANVTLSGHLSENEKFSELGAADIFVLPTHTEGFPLSLLEGMAMSLPVVTTPVGGISEVVKDGVNGYLVQPRDVEALAERILRMVREPALRHQMGQANARLYWEQLSADKAVDRIHAIFEELI